MTIILAAIAWPKIITAAVCAAAIIAALYVLAKA